MPLQVQIWKYIQLLFEHDWAWLAMPNVPNVRPRSESFTLGPNSDDNPLFSYSDLLEHK